MFKYAFILTQKTAHSDNKSHPSEVRRKSPGAVLISFFVILISFLYRSYIVLSSSHFAALSQPLAKINRGSTERQRDVVVDINLAVTFGTGFDRTVL